MSYTRVMWKDKEDSATTPLNAYNLNVMDKGIEDVDKKADSALAIADIGRLGRIKPDGVTTRVSKDGTLTAIGGGGGGGGTTAVAVDFDDTVSQLGVNNVQDAIDKVYATAGGGYSKEEVDEKFNEVTTKLQDNADYLKCERNIFNISEVGSFSFDGTNLVYGSGNYASIIKVKPNTKYTISGDSFYVCQTVDYPAFGVAYTDLQVFSTAPQTIMTNANTNYLVVLFCWFENNSEYDLRLHSFQVEEGETVTEYEAPRKSNVDITKELSNLSFHEVPFSTNSDVTRMGSADDTYCVGNGNIIDLSIAFKLSNTRSGMILTIPNIKVRKKVCIIENLTNDTYVGIGIIYVNPSNGITELYSYVALTANVSYRMNVLTSII